jgi:aspartate/methionine/tyrosine aminotransferase
MGVARLSVSAKATKADKETSTNGNLSFGGGFSLSNKIFRTLDPCVVKTKEWMGSYAHLWEDDPDGIVSLAQGVVYWKPPQACRNALVEAVGADKGGEDEDNEESDPLALHSYSPARGLPELIAALEEKIAKEHAMTDHDVTVTVGANQAYTNIVLTLLGDENDNNNKAVVFAPYYFNHVMAIQMCAGPEAVVVGPSDMATGVPDLEWLERTLADHQRPETATNGIRMVTLVNPGNPTGVALPKETVKRVVDLCKAYGVWVVLDCTYEHFFNTGESGSGDGDDGERHAPNPLPTFPDDPHVVHVFSFSKGYAMAGYRCGYLVTAKANPSSRGSSGEFLEQMLKVQDTIPIGPPRLTQHVALGALKQGSDATRSSGLYSPTSKEWVYQKYATLDASRECILEALSSLPEQIGGSGSMYLMAKLPDNLDLADKGDDQDEPVDVVFCRLLVRDYGIAIIPGSFCGSPGWIRICYANLTPGKTKVAAERLQRGIQELASRQQS